MDKSDTVFPKLISGTPRFPDILANCSRMFPQVKGGMDPQNGVSGTKIP